MQLETLLRNLVSPLILFVYAFPGIIFAEKPNRDPLQDYKPFDICGASLKADCQVMPNCPSREPSYRETLTPKEKFEYTVHQGIFSPRAFLYPAVGAAIQQLYDPLRGRKPARDEFGDTLSRWAMNYAFSASTQVVGSFALASIFKQDPRYKPSGRAGFKRRLYYAVSRVFVTEGYDGNEQFNISFVGGSLAASGLANTWSPAKDVGLSNTLQRLGISLAVGAGRFGLEEFGPDIKKRFFKKGNK